LPESYLDLLGRSNGVESCVNDSGGDVLTLWAASELARKNREYQVQQWLPTVLAFGSDGGGDAIAFQRLPASDPEQWPVVRVGFGDLDPGALVVLAPGFGPWVANGCRLG
jgi:hypothetical protein